MVHTRKRTTLAILAAALLLVSGSALAASDAGAWSGTVEAVTGDDIALVGVPAHFRLAGSVTEMVSGRSLAAQTLAPGTSITLRVADREADGRLRADGVVVQAKSPLSVTGSIGRISEDRSHIEVQGVEIELDRSTGFSGRGGSGSIRSARDLRAGTTVSASLVPTTSGTLRAADIRGNSGGGEDGEDQELEGILTAVSDAAWTVDGKVFAITDQTVFEGDPAAGDRVEVKFHADATGALVADRIETEDDAPAREAEFRGIVEAIGVASWTISGQVVAVAATTRILGAPVVGSAVEVHAVRAADGSLTASEIKLEDGTDDQGDDHGNDGGNPAPTTGSGGGADDGSGHDAGDDNGGQSGGGSGNGGSTSGGGINRGHGNGDN